MLLLLPLRKKSHQKNLYLNMMQDPRMLSRNCLGRRVKKFQMINLKITNMLLQAQMKGKERKRKKQMLIQMTHKKKKSILVLMITNKLCRLMFIVWVFKLIWKALIQLKVARKWMIMQGSFNWMHKKKIKEKWFKLIWMDKI